MSTDLILHNVKIATNGMPSQVGAIAVSDGKISASGTNGEIFRLRGSGPNLNYWALWSAYEF